jgi:2-oxoglutarate/2-oxoacid ferredoxin oxidoreductase subunit alpha
MDSNTIQSGKKIIKNVLTDASMLITEAAVRTGADVYIGYPITPSNRFYNYASQRFPVFMAGPDEISVMQWMCGFSAAGKFSVTATAFPGLALMAEGINMAYMMELPMLIILTQRLGPSTGSATTGAEGDLMFLNGIISGYYPVPVISHSGFEDAWTMTNEAIKLALKLKTPVVLLTSKELVMTTRTFDISLLSEIREVEKFSKDISDNFFTYKSDQDLIPEYVPVGNENVQIRLNSSTHNEKGFIGKNDPESMNNTKRLNEKFMNRIDEFTFYEYDNQIGSIKLVVTYGISSEASRDAVMELRESGMKISLLIVNTLLPVSTEIVKIINLYKEIIIVEENYRGIYADIIFGQHIPDNVKKVNKIGNLISPDEIIKIAKS